MAVLRDGPEGIESLLIQRSVREGDPASGQVGLPGGRKDPGDVTLLGTALREAAEEVGLAPGDLAAPPRSLGVFAASAFGLDVAVFVAELGPGSPHLRAADPEEVESIFWLPSARLRAPEPVVRTTRLGPLTVAAVRHEGHVVWGFTLRVLQELRGHLEGSAGGPPTAQPR